MTSGVGRDGEMGSEDQQLALYDSLVPLVQETEKHPNQEPIPKTNPSRKVEYEV